MKEKHFIMKAIQKNVKTLYTKFDPKQSGRATASNMMKVKITLPQNATRV